MENQKFIISDSIALFNPLDCQEVTIIGAGGIGCPTVLALGLLGVRTIRLYDYDILEAHNGPGEPFYSPTCIGKPKVEAAMETFRFFKIEKALTTYCERVTATTKLEGGIIIAGPDSMASRKEIWVAVKRSYDEDGLIDLYVDFRSSGTSLTIITLDMTKQDEIVRYEEEWLYSDEEASQEPCGARNVTYMGFMVGYYVSHIVALHTKGKLREVLPDLVKQIYLDPYLENPFVVE